MKTRHILTAMVLPALFAACTAEDIVENNSNINFGERAKLAPITFMVGGDAETRLAFDETGVGNWTWESEDAFSAFLVDYNGTADDKLFTNYIYKSEDGEAYRTTSQMVEGIYWFYAPSPQDKNTRDLIPFKLATAQDADYYKSEDAQVFFTGLYNLTKEDNPQDIKLSLMNYYSRAVFPFTNNTDKAVTIKQIALTANKPDAFVVEGEISTKKLANCMYGFDEDGKLVPAVNLDKDPKNDVKLSDIKEALQKGDFNATNAEATKKTNVLVLNLGEGVTIAKGATETFTMLVPRTEAGVYCDVTVIANEGVMTISSTDKSNYAKNVQFKHNGIMPMFGLQSNNAFKPYSIEEGKFEDLKDAYYVASYDDMIDLINTVNGEFSVYNIGEWNVDAAMAEAITKSDAFVNFSQAVTISDEEEVELTKVAFNEGVTIAEGTNVTFAANEDDELVNVVKGAFIVEEGAEVTLVGGDFTSATIENAGELTLTKTATEVDKIISTGVLTLVDNAEAKITLNAGTLNYTAADAKKGFSYTTQNHLKLIRATKQNVAINVGAGVTLTVKGDNLVLTSELNNDVVYSTTMTNNGTIVLANNALWVEASAKLINNGKINSTNKNTLQVKGSVDNAANAVINPGKVDIQEGAVVNNAGELKATESVTNNGKIITVSGSKTLVTAGKGEINNTAKAYVSATSATDQVISYTFKDANSKTLDDLNTKLYSINKIVLKGKTTVDAELINLDGVKTIELPADATLYMDPHIAQGVLASNLLITGNATISGFHTNESGFGFKENAKIIISKNSTLTIKDITITALENKTLTFESESATAEGEKAGQVVNNGEVYVGTTSVPVGEWWTGTSAKNGVAQVNWK